MIYILFISVLFLSAKLRVEKNVISDSIALQKQADVFFDNVYAGTEQYNQMQSIRNILVYSMQNPDLDIKGTQEFSELNCLPENITIYNLEKQIYPPFNFMMPLPAHVSNNEQMKAIVDAKGDNVFYLYVPYYNFTKTVILGYLCVEIPSTKLYGYIDQGFQNDLRFKLLDIDRDKIFANVVSDKLMLSEQSTSDLYGITCVVYGDLYSEYNSAKLFSIMLIPICLIVLLISYFYANKTAKKFSAPINMLIEFIEANKNGQLTYTYKEPISFSEINTLFAKYYEIIDEINDLIDRNQKSNLLKAEAELRLLQDKINPHFLFNALELISGQAILENAEKTSELIQNLGYLFRYDLRLPDVVSLKEEIKQSRNYMNMQNTIFNNTLNFEYQIEQNLMDIAIPKCTFQPILENCFKHAFSEIIDKNIRIKVFVNGDNLNVVFQDNGKGINEEKLKYINQSLIRDCENFAYFIDRNEHIGLRNVNARLCLHFKLPNALKIENNLSGGTKVTISVPMIKCMKKGNQ